MKIGHSSERAIEAASLDERLQVVAQWGLLDGPDDDAWRGTGEVAQLDLFFDVAQDYGLSFGQTIQSLEMAIRLERELRAIEGADG